MRPTLVHAMEKEALYEQRSQCTSPTAEPWTQDFDAPV